MDNTPLCLDTNVLIDYLKGREPSSTAVEHAVKNYACHVTAITVYELLFGVARTKKEIGEQALLGLMKVLPLSGSAAQQAAILHAELISRNQDIGIKDTLIAAICLETGLPLLTTNSQHFARVAALQVFTPSALISKASPA